MSTTAVREGVGGGEWKEGPIPLAKEAGREAPSRRVGQAQGGEPEGQRTSWPPQGDSPETGPARVIIEGEGVLGFAKGRE